MKTIFLDRQLKNITNISELKYQQSSCIFNINILVAFILLTSWWQIATKIMCFVVNALTLVKLKYGPGTIIDNIEQY